MPSSRSASPTSRSSEPFAAAARQASPRPSPHAVAIAFKLVAAPALVFQALQTRRRAPVLPEADGPREGRAGQGVGDALRVLVAGDSSAAGVGVARQEQAVVGHLLRTLAALHDGPIDWHLRARSGHTTRRVHEALEADPPSPVDVAIVITGVNDVIDLVPVRRALAARVALADGLLARGLARHVAFAPLPPMQQFPLLPGLLRRVLGDDALRHNQAMARWAATRRDVSVAPLDITLGPETMASDGFHPGEPVYRVCGEALGAHAAKVAGLLGHAGCRTLD